MAGKMMHTPEGTRDLVYGECKLHRSVQKQLTNVFQKFGYSEIATPAVEYWNVFSKAGSAVPEQGTLKMIDRDGSVLVLRPDCTLPIARVATTRLSKEALPLRLYYNQTIFRSAAAHAGRMSEMDQCGVELIGADGRRADAEAVALALEALKSCGLVHFKIELGHAAFFKALADELNTDEERVEVIRSLIEQKSFAALDDLLKEEFSDRASYQALRKLSRLFGGREVLDQAKNLTKNPVALEALDELNAVYEELCSAGWGDYVGFDLGLVHQIDYYTGMVFCGYAEGAGQAVVAGGRYNRMMEIFGRNAPATGFAVDVYSVTSAMQEEPYEKPQKLVFYETGCLGRAMRLQEEAPSGFLELSCGETVEQSRAIAKSKGISTLIIVTETSVKEETV